MKIAIVSTLHSPILPAFPGGIEVFNYNLSAELSQKKRKHEVVLFASGDSKVKSKLFAVCPKALFKGELDPNNPQNMRKIIYLENHYYIKAIEYIKKNNFDIIHHSHTSFLPIYLGYKARIPQLLTTHMTDNANITLNLDLKELMPKQKGIALISVSRRQAKILGELNFFGNVYHGINIDDFLFEPSPQNYFAWLGRIASNKGTEEAVKIALKAKTKLKIAGNVGVGKNVVEYFEKIQRNYFDNPLISYQGPAGPEARNKLLSQARGLLFPIQWEEPFGLVMIETMACGTPVVAFNRGSVPEIVEDGKTGFICPPRDIDCMVKRVKQIYDMPQDQYLSMRKNCRKHVEEKFTVEKMVDGYEKVYQKVIEDWKKK